MFLVSTTTLNFDKSTVSTSRSGVKHTHSVPVSSFATKTLRCHWKFGSSGNPIATWASGMSRADIAYLRRGFHTASPSSSPHVEPALEVLGDEVSGNDEVGNRVASWSAAGPAAKVASGAFGGGRASRRFPAEWRRPSDALAQRPKGPFFY